jgi:hypothetical protein
MASRAVAIEQRKVEDDISDFKMRFKGAMESNLRNFANNGSFSIYGQCYERKTKHIPIVTTTEFLSTMVFLYDHINVRPVAALNDYHEEDLVKAFQYYAKEHLLVYEKEYASDYNFDAMWARTRMARGLFFKNALHFHENWMLFFKSKKAIVVTTIRAIERAVQLRMRMEVVGGKLGAINRDIDALIAGQLPKERSTTAFTPAHATTKELAIRLIHHIPSRPITAMPGTKAYYLARRRAISDSSDVSDEEDSEEEEDAPPSTKRKREGEDLAGRPQLAAKRKREAKAEVNAETEVLGGLEIDDDVLHSLLVEPLSDTALPTDGPLLTGEELMQAFEPI